MAGYENADTAFGAMTDETLVRLFRAGEVGALEEIVDRYISLIRSRASCYFIPGAEKDDIIQEGMIGLYKAVMEFDETKASSFSSFAAACVRNNIITAVKSAARKKNMPLNSYVSLTKSSFDDEGETLMDIIAHGREGDPEAIVIDRENADGIECTLNKALSKFELEVLLEYLSGGSYADIAGKLGRDVKAIDNAIQRVKKKLEILLNKT